MERIKVKIRAKTKKGRAAMQREGEQSKTGNAALRLCKFKLETIKKDPLTILISLKVPGPVASAITGQIITALETKFEEAGAIRGKDYIMEGVLNE